MSVALSDAEVDALLASRPAGGALAPAKATRAHVFGAAAPQLGGELGALGLLHERFARSLRRAFLPLLRYQPKVVLGRIESRAYDDYVAGQQGRLVCFNIVRAEPLRGNLLIAIPPALVSALVDGFFGGKARPAARGQSEFTPTEERVIQRLLEGMCAGLARAWEDIAPLRFAYVGTESNPQLAMFLETDDAVLLCPFTVELEGSDDQATIDILYPVQMLKPVLPALRSKVQAERTEGSADWRQRLADALLDVPVPLRAVLAEPSAALGQLVRLAPGDTLSIQVGNEVRLLAGRTVIGTGALGEAHSMSAVRLTHRVGLAHGHPAVCAPPKTAAA